MLKMLVRVGKHLDVNPNNPAALVGPPTDDTSITLYRNKCCRFAMVDGCKIQYVEVTSKSTNQIRSINTDNECSNVRL